MNNQFVKSPMNYNGNKYKLLSQIVPIIQGEYDIFVDMFCGGCDVVANVNCDTRIANDINYHVIGIFESLKEYGATRFVEQLEQIINYYGLSKTNESGFISLRKDYNNNELHGFNFSIMLYALICYSFNNQPRFNNNHEYNSSFARNRSSFTSNMRSRVFKFEPLIQDVSFSSKDFRDLDISMLTDKSFVYVDSPYSISTAQYNDGKRGFKGWGVKDDINLMNILDRLDDDGIKFAMSNVLRLDDKTNDLLIEWSNKYNVHRLDFTYNNSSYHKKNKSGNTEEVLITNY